MANLELTGEQQETLYKALLSAFPDSDHFAQFLKSRLNLVLQHFWSDDYRKTLVKLILELQPEGRLRELVRKARIAKSGNQAIGTFADTHLSQDESLVEILEPAFQWEFLLDCWTRNVGTLDKVPAGLLRPLDDDPETAAHQHARLCGDLVDALAAKAENPQLDLKFAILEYSLVVLRATTSESIASKLREWIRLAAGQRGVRPPDVLLVHLEADAAAVQELQDALGKIGLRAVRRTLTEGPPAGAWNELLRRAQQEIARTAVCVSPQTVEFWRSSTAAAALDSRPSGGRSAVFPVLLRIAREHVTLPSFLPPNTWVEFRDRLDDDAAVQLLKDRISRLESRESAAETVFATTPLIEEAAEKLSSLLRDDDVVFLLGPAASRPPSGYSVSQRLLRELAIRMADGEPVLPIDLAGTYYAIKKTEPRLQARIREFLAEGQFTLPSTHARLAELLRIVPGCRQPNRSQEVLNRRSLIVTTNLDLMMERALLMSGVSFTRVVQHWQGKDDSGKEKPFIVNHYGVRTVAQGVNVLDGWPTVLRTDDTGWANVDEAIRGAGYRTESRATLSLAGDPGQPILYKFHGSHDVDTSCAISSDHYDAFDVTAVPQVIAERVTTKPLLLLGYCYTDPAFRHLKRTLFRSLASNIFDRYAVQYPLPGEGEAAFYEVERALSANLLGVWRRLMMQPIESDGATVLSEILRQLDPNNDLRKPA